MQDDWKIKKIVESGSIIYRVILDYFMLKDAYEKDPKRNRFFDCHHPIPRAVVRVIEKKIKNGDIDSGKLKRLRRYKMTKEIPMLFHRNFNEIFEGDCLLTQVLTRLDDDIFNANYCVTSNADKEKILKFMFYVAYHNDKCIDPDYISGEVARKYALVPKEMAKLFDVTYDDTIKYLADNFFYPDYEEYWDVWNLLEEIVHKNPLPFIRAEEDAMAYVS